MKRVSWFLIGFLFVVATFSDLQVMAQEQEREPEQKPAPESQEEVRTTEDTIAKEESGPWKGLPASIADAMKTVLEQDSAEAGSQQANENQSQDAQAHVSPSQRTALQTAADFIYRIRGDADVRNRYLQRLAVLRGKAGLWEDAVRDAEEITSYRRLLTLAQLAREALQQDQADLALALQKRSLAAHKALRENQNLELNLERALTHASLGQFGEASHLRGEFPASHEYREVVLSAISREQTPSGGIPENPEDVMPRDYVKLAQKAFEEGNNALAMIHLEKARGELAAYEAWTRLELLPKIVQGLLDLGEREKARVAAADFAKLSLAMTDELEGKTRMLAKVCGFYTTFGEKDAVNRLLEVAESIVEEPSATWFGHSYGGLGQAYYLADQQDKAYETWSKGLSRVMENINHRVRAKEAAEIFLCMHEVGAAPAEDVKSVAENIRQTL